MTINFEQEVDALASDILNNNGASVINGDYDEQVIVEAYRAALRKGGLAMLGPLADSSLRAHENKKASGELVFEIFADAVDAATVSECEKVVWTELESRAVELRKLTLTNQQRPKLALLKVANELLRRLSPTQEPMLCGRVLMLLATALPLSDNSGFNMAGKYNFENETVIETASQFAEGGSNPKDYPSYERFWKLQKYLSGPFVLQHLTDLKTCLEGTLQTFESKPVLSMEKDSRDGDFAPKYLTAGRLLSLQLADPKLRRFVLVQVLFFIRQVSLFAESTNNADLTTVSSHWRSRTLKLLNQIPPDGPSFASAIVAAVDREVIWESWKKEKCPPIEQPVNELDSNLFSSSAFAQASIDQKNKPVEPPSWTTGTNRDWEDAVLGDKEDDDDDEYERDPVELFSYRMLDALQPGYDTEIYDPRKDFVYCWQGMRVARQKRLDVFVEAENFEDVTRKLHNLPPAEKKQMEEPSTKETSSSSSSMDVVDVKPAAQEDGSREIADHSTETTFEQKKVPEDTIVIDLEGETNDQGQDEEPERSTKRIRMDDVEEEEDVIQIDKQ